MPTCFVYSDNITFMFRRCKGILCIYIYIIFLIKAAHTVLGWNWDLSLSIQNAKLANFVMPTDIMNQFLRNYLSRFSTETLSTGLNLSYGAGGVGHGYIYDDFQHQHIKVRSHTSVDNFSKWCNSKPLTCTKRQKEDNVFQNGGTTLSILSYNQKYFECYICMQDFLILNA